MNIKEEGSNQKKSVLECDRIHCAPTLMELSEYHASSFVWLPGSSTVDTTLL